MIRLYIILLLFSPLLLTSQTFNYDNYMNILTIVNKDRTVAVTSESWYENKKGIRVWNIENNDLIDRFDVQDVKAMRFSSDESELYLTVKRTDKKVIDLLTREVRTVDHFDDEIVYDQKGERKVLTTDFSLSLLNMSDGSTSWNYKVERPNSDYYFDKAVYHISSNSFLYSCYIYDKKGFLFMKKADSDEEPERVYKGDVARMLATSQNNRYVLFSMGDRGLMMFDLDTKTMLWQEDFGTELLTRNLNASFTPSSDKFIFVDRDRVKFYNTLTGQSSEEGFKMDERINETSSLFSFSTGLISFARQDGSQHIHDLYTGEKVAEIEVASKETIDALAREKASFYQALRGEKSKPSPSSSSTPATTIATKGAPQYVYTAIYKLVSGGISQRVDYFVLFYELTNNNGQSEQYVKSYGRRLADKLVPSGSVLNQEFLQPNEDVMKVKESILKQGNFKDFQVNYEYVK